MLRRSGEVVLAMILVVAVILVFTLAAILIGRWFVRGRALATPPPTKATPYRDIIERVESAGGSAQDAHGIQQAFLQRDRYLHALEAIATLNQDSTAQRIAKQALGKP
jgi:flagellar basal body-associated protein FliL